ncbi:hypothetical protein BKA70DRAFT_1256657 [Coprinopsis sp. MPI-PUGE-AT-0042]|nr:hypothetical protein BKA70DRAFT_1256657 [Coprinopsis sp. MPI-PUGE-AT-0042]
MAESKKRSQELIDTQILSFEHSIVCLKRRRNELTPVSSLPAELLSMIFHLCTLTDTPSTQCSALATLTSVSARWRAVALGNPSLWTNISLLLPAKWQAAFVERSGSAPMSVKLLTTGSPDRPPIDALLAHASRISRIVFEGDSRTVNDVVAALTSPAPLLEALKMTVVDKCPTFGLRRGAVLTHSPYHLQTPRLRSVDFTNCALPWTSSAFKTITSIKITFEDCSPPFTSGELYEGLKVVAPHLHELELHFAIDLQEEAAIYSPIALPKLQRLALSHSDEDSIGLLHFLHFPTSVHLDLNCESSDMEEIVSICSDIKRSWVSAPLSKASPPPPLYRLSISHTYDEELEVFGWDRYADGMDDETGRILAIRSLADEDDFSTIINIILGSLPLRDLRALELDGRWTNTSDLQQILSKMPALREIKFSGYVSSVSTFCSLILEDASGESATPEITTPPTALSLQVITLEYIPRDELPAIVERLSRALAGRCARGVGSIQNIILKSCGSIDEDILKQLKDFNVTGVKNVIRIK